MDPLSLAWYEIAFERCFLKKKGSEFQDFFSELMEKRYPGDFVRVQPWGRAGDRKNDGYLRSKRTLFGVYAPKEMKAKQTINKIDTDFRGALPHWKDWFDTWIFVHNDRDGLAPDILKKLLQLGQEHSDVTVKSWGFEELRQELFKLPDSEIASLLGFAPTQDHVLKIQFKDLQPVLDHIARQAPMALEEIRPVAKGKIVANALSHDVEILLNNGQRKERLVEQLFAKYYDPTLGDRLAATFKTKYDHLEGAGLSPDDVFWELQKFAGGGQSAKPERQVAVLAVLAYFFNRCDIFKDRRKGAQE